ncbi:g12678 [Coccomyxa viridis]|uniref:G12678 protein n=1 Tax=Coccomyxa viridis TaxID=1274662 RepID=A0ABP1GAY5_9CHLO
MNGDGGEAVPARPGKRQAVVPAGGAVGLRQSFRSVKTNCLLYPNKHKKGRVPELMPFGLKSTAGGSLSAATSEELLLTIAGRLPVPGGFGGGELANSGVPPAPVTWIPPCNPAARPPEAQSNKKPDDDQSVMDV